MENNATDKKQQKSFILSEGAVENVGAGLLLTAIGFIGYQMYAWLSSFVH